MPSVNSSGTQAAIVGTEHTLATVNQAGTFVLTVDQSPLQLGDTLELRLYVKVLGTSTSRVAYKVSNVGPRPEGDTVTFSVPVPVTHQLVATLKMTTGVGRSFDWELQAQ